MTFAPVAQRIERLPPEQEVVGSIPTGRMRKASFETIKGGFSYKTHRGIIGQNSLLVRTGLL